MVAAHPTPSGGDPNPRSPMFERLNTPQEAYPYKLGATLKMEQTVLEMLGDKVDEAQDEMV